MRGFVSLRIVFIVFMSATGLFMMLMGTLQALVRIWDVNMLRVQLTAMVFAAASITNIAAAQPTDSDRIRSPVLNPTEVESARYYPIISARLGEQGLVVLLVTVSADGTCEEATVSQSSIIDLSLEAAIQSSHDRFGHYAVRLCEEELTWSPALLDGLPVETTTTIAIRYEFPGLAINVSE